VPGDGGEDDALVAAAVFDGAIEHTIRLTLSLVKPIRKVM
jgi:hypothetical protein